MSPTFGKLIWHACEWATSFEIHQSPLKELQKTISIVGMFLDGKPFFSKAKGTISDSLGLRKIFKPFGNKNTCQSQHAPFFLKKSYKFDRKTTFHQISFRGC